LSLTKKLSRVLVAPQRKRPAPRGPAKAGWLAPNGRLGYLVTVPDAVHKNTAFGAEQPPLNSTNENIRRRPGKLKPELSFFVYRGAQEQAQEHRNNYEDDFPPFHNQPFAQRLL